jgi:hypothetical protein
MKTMLRCGGDHDLARGGIICVHFADGVATEWVHADRGRPECEHDWLCPKCAAQVKAGGPPDDDLLMACVDCIRKLQAAARAPVPAVPSGGGEEGHGEEVRTGNADYKTRVREGL